MSDASEMVEVEVWVMVDEDGDVTVSQDRDELEQPTGLATRIVKLTVNVPKPKPVELIATIAEESAAGELKIAD
jgi:hypothetical protein